MTLQVNIGKTIVCICFIFYTNNNNVTNKTRYLIVGNAGNPCWAYSCYGRKIEDAIERRKKGQNLTIINEIDFWDTVEDLL